MERPARTLLESLRRHLDYRLRTTRENNNVVEVLACFCDPFAHLWAKALFTREQYEVIDRIVVAFATPKDVQAGERRNVSQPPLKRFAWDDRDEPKPPQTSADLRLREELASFKTTGFELFPNAIEADLTVGAVIAAAKRVNPLVFWTEAQRSKFPMLFKVAGALAGASCHSCLQESVFSSANDTLTSRRKRLLESPDLFEALVVMRYALSLNGLNSSERAGTGRAVRDADVNAAAAEEEEVEIL